MNSTRIQDNVDLIEVNNKKIYLIGTAHISQASADLAEQFIRDIKPDSVAVELCDSRYQSLKDPDRWKNTDIVSVIRSGKSSVLMAQLMLSSFQKKLGKQLNIKPGAEMMRSINVADELNLRIVLADRDVRTTLKRVWSSLGFWGGAKFIFSMIFAAFTPMEISQEEIEKIKSEDALANLMNEFSQKMPRIRKTLIDERDQYLAAKIQDAPGDSVVAVVGAGHVAGIKSYFGQPIDTSALEVIPPKSLTSKLIAWSIPALILGFVVYGFFGSGFGKSFEMIEAWFLITGIMGAIGAALALGHPLTVLSAFLATPLATLHPLIAAGWIAGLVEAWLKKPRVADFETITDDITSLKGVWRNRVSRILLVVAFTNIFATIGMIWGTKVLANLATIGPN